MLSEQFVWGRSKAILSVLLLVSSTYSFSMEQDEHQESIDRSKMFYTYTQGELEDSYDRSPKKLKYRIAKLLHPTFMNTPQVRGLFFVGEPGTDKSTAALMVAYKLQDKFGYEVIDCPDLTDDKRGGGTKALRNKLELVLETESTDPDERGTIVILDESQELLEHAEDPHYDTASTGRYLTSWINKQRMNSKAFVITTCNDYRTFPKQIQGRMIGNMIKFKELIEPESKIKAFFTQLEVHGITLAPLCNKALLENEIRAIKGWVGRDFEAFSAVVSDKYLDDGGDLDSIQVNENQIRRAIKSISKDKNVAKQSNLTEKKLREESLQLQKTALKLQAEALEQQEEALEQQQDQHNAEMHRRALRAGMDMGAALYGEMAPDWAYSAADANCTIQ